jgi:hypothetical protein
MYCRQCGTEIIEDGKFCHKCGYPVDFIPAPVKKKAFNVHRYVVSMRIAIALLIICFTVVLFGPFGAAFLCQLPIILLVGFISFQRSKAIRYGVSMDESEEIDIKTRGEQNKLMRKHILLMICLLVLMSFIVTFRSAV